MFVFNINPPLFRAAIYNKYLLLNHVKYYNRKINTVQKRGSMLIERITNKDKRNKWHFNLVSDKPKARLFERVHKPHRRRTVLNSLFIKNITDVISTGDAVPEISNYGIEITGVRIAPCFKILNVFWQVPVSKFDLCKDISNILNFAAPKIRAELISRNVLGRVPHIHFLRDSTNAKISEFEKSMQNLDVGPKSDSNVVVDDSFVQDIFSFKITKVEKKVTEVLKDDKKELTDSNIDTKEESDALPQKPADMKCDIFGLNHDIMMEKIIALKKKKKEPKIKTALISLDSLRDGDIFDKIPGTRYEASSFSRNEILKKFQVERKVLMQKKKTVTVSDGGNQQYEDEGTNSEDFDTAGIDLYEEDFIDDESNNNSHS